MLAVITFAFAGGLYKRKKYLFKTDIKNLKHGEMVLVEAPNGGYNLAMFHRYSEKDWFPEKKKKNVVKRAHWKTVQSFVQQRQAIFEDYYEVLPRAIEDIRNLIPEYKGLTDEEVRKLLIHRVTVAGKAYNKNEKIILYPYDKICIVTINKRIINVKLNSKPEIWKSPAQLEKYLV